MSYQMNPDVRHRPNSSSVVPANRKTSREGTIGGPCHAVTTAGTFCTRKATMIASDGYGYCKRHAR